VDPPARIFDLIVRVALVSLVFVGSVEALHVSLDFVFMTS
jgi:hypothetical protein